MGASVGASDFARSQRTVAGQAVSVICYRLGESWYCKVENAEPGGVISRGIGPSREQACQAALIRAEVRLERHGHAPPR